MKNLGKITTVASLLVFVCLLISACGGGTEQLARNNGDVAISVTDSSVPAVPQSGVLVEQRQTQGTGTLTNVGTTPATGKLTFTGTAGNDYFFTFSKTGFVTQTDISRTPNLTSNVALDVTLVANP